MFGNWSVKRRASEGHALMGVVRWRIISKSNLTRADYFRFVYTRYRDGLMITFSPIKNPFPNFTWLLSLAVIHNGVSSKDYPSACWFISKPKLWKMFGLTCWNSASDAFVQFTKALVRIQKKLKRKKFRSRLPFCPWQTVAQCYLHPGRISSRWTDGQDLLSAARLGLKIGGHSWVLKVKNEGRKATWVQSSFLDRFLGQFSPTHVFKGTPCAYTRAASSGIVQALENGDWCVQVWKENMVLGNCITQTGKTCTWSRLADTHTHSHS